MTTDIQAWRSQLKNLAARLQRAQGKLLLSHQMSPIDVLRLVTDFHIPHIIQESNPTYELELDAAIVMIEQPDIFIQFPMSTILSPGLINADVEGKLRHLNISFHKSEQKAEILLAIEKCATELKASRSLIEDINLVADEIITNSIYNAPVAGKSRPVPRKEKVIIPEDMSCNLSLGYNSERLVLLCEDNYGSLDLDSYFTRIRKCYEEGQHESINWGVGGAGIGSFMVFQSCSSLFCGVKEAKRTVVACVFPMGKNYRKKNEFSKSIHYAKM